ncbi:uncharacterized protein [Miscanthus floridulus]|uniref:uncharacterized protein n=1 Tax=Miscanthus floridulus TaxID=154761 RepID=UPI0034581874
MDSGNSGSLQSSSGGDDDFDSRCGADSSPLSALLRQPPPSVPGFGGGSLIYGLQELRTPPLSHWCSTTAPLPAGAEASVSPPSLSGHGAPTAVSAAADQADAAPAQAAAAAPPRGSRKRARASRRVPTTVLTTDTSNFRAMVQEFTGIPAPPFAGAATTARSRFDHHLFPLRTATAAAGTASPATLPQYLVRPFEHKVLVHASSTPYPPSFTWPSTSSPAPANISIAPASTTTPGTTAVASSSDSYHQLTAASTSALLGMQQDHGSNNYHSFHQSSSLGDGKYAARPVFDRGIAPLPSSATRLQDPADFLGLTYDVMLGSQGPHTHLHPRNGGDVLSGLVGGASVTGADGCKATYSSTRPLLERNRRNPSADGSTATTTTAPVAAAAGMRTQAGVVDSWVCTSD